MYPYPRSPTSFSRSSSSQSASSSTSSTHFGSGFSESPRIPMDGFDTPLESPVESFALKTPTSLDRTLLATPTSPNTLFGGHVVYAVDQIRQMAAELTHARQHENFPKSVSSNQDTQSIIDDHRLLLELRQIRGDPCLPASDEYKKLRVEIARRIHERDALLDEESSREEAARRVDFYLRSVEQERRYFEATNSMMQRRGITNPTQEDLDKFNEEIFSIIEKAAETTMADAASPLRMNVGHFKIQNQHLEKQIEQQEQQIQWHRSVIDGQVEQQQQLVELHRATIDRQINHDGQQNNLVDLALDRHNDTIKTLQALVHPQSMNLQATTQNITSSTRLVEQLSQTLIGLNSNVTQVIAQAVQQQTAAAIKEVTEAQNQVMVELQQEYRRMRDLSRAHHHRRRNSGSSQLSTVKLQSLSSTEARRAKRSPMQSNSRPLGAIRKMLRKGFGRQ